MPKREILQELVLEPGTGKALKVLRGQILRIEQVVGHQCADFNCFNLHDYKEYMHTGRTRHLHSLRPTKGAFLWSAPPRERPMMYILEDTVGTNDAIYPRCTAFLYEFHYGLPVHANCHDIQAEAQREYGLTPDDVHDSLNWFVSTGIDTNGNPYLAKNKAKKGDFVELLALIDVLAIPNVCGADVMATNDFEYKPLKVVVSASTEEDWTQVPEIETFRNQRTPADFKIKDVKADRELRGDPDYSPDFTNVPITVSDVKVRLSGEEADMLQRLKETDEFGDTDGEVLRYIFFSWWIENFMRGPKHVRAR